MSDDGTVGSDIPALEGVLSGKGTGRLVVKGGTVAVDATALFVPGVLVDYTSQQPTATPFTLSYLPGGHNLQGPGGEGVVLFTVSDDGTVGYDPALEGVLSGKGTGRLVVKGGTVAVDATALFVPGVLVDYTSQQPTATPFTLSYLPGGHNLQGPGGEGVVLFTVSDDGTVGYDPASKACSPAKGQAGWWSRAARWPSTPRPCSCPASWLTIPRSSPRRRPSRCPTCPAATTSRASEAKASFFSL